MPVLKDITVQLQDADARPIPTFADPEYIQTPNKAKSDTATSCLIQAKPNQPFRIIITSPTTRPAGLPQNCNVLRIHISINGTLVLQGDLHRDDVSLEVKITKGLSFPPEAGVAAAAAADNTLPAPPSSKSRWADSEAREITVELIPCQRWMNAADAAAAAVADDDDKGNKGHQATSGRFEETVSPIPDACLTFTFKYRSSTELQQYLLLPPSLSLLNPNPELLSTESSTETDSEYLICCGRRLQGAPNSPTTGTIPWTGIIKCDNERCQAPGQAWHKFCVGMELWEEPEELWLCPNCRVRPREQILIKSGPPEEENGDDVWEEGNLGLMVE